MAQIKILDRAVIEQIAAGEVIERPASIIKELLENSIDAGATRVDIVVEHGGLSLIKITDNGCGITKDELTLAVTRHATSKISEAKDLYSIGTMGFRGEALASIAAVSRFKVSSSEIGDGMGWCQPVTGGVAGDLEPVSHLKGTTIEVADLFFNLPARKKFLKTEKAETMAVSRIIEQVILSFPSVHFTAKINGKRSYDVPQVDTIRMRIAQVAGSDLASKLVHCRAETDEMTADIFISPPEQARKRPRYQNLYVNLRKIESDSVTFGIREAFSRFLDGTYKPDWFCYLDVDPAKIDVNVHPTKQKIKFDDEKSIFSFVFRAVKNGMTIHREEQFEVVRETTSAGMEVVSYPTEPARRGSTSFTAEPREVKIHTFGAPAGEPVREPVIYTTPERPREEGVMQTSIPLALTGGDSAEVGDLNMHGTGIPGAVWESINCFQLHRRYIVTPVKDGVMLIDQHAAHERILYEQVLNGLAEGAVPSQQLLYPITFELPPEEKEILLSMREFFETTGFEIQDFGGNSVAVSAVPATGTIKSTQVKDSIEEMLQQFIEEDDDTILSSSHRRFAASYACGAAIKFGHEMPQEEMNSLIHQLFAVENPNICPHGRPTIIKLTLDELAKRFLR